MAEDAEASERKPCKRLKVFCAQQAIEDDVTRVLNKLTDDEAPARRAVFLGDDAA